MSLELKIKSKHLSVEARIIRFEERKLEKQIAWMQKNYTEWRKWRTEQGIAYSRVSSAHWRIQSHRKQDVGQENRATFLARAFLAGMPYKQVEQKRRPEFEIIFQRKVLPRALKMIQKYGATDAMCKTTMEQLQAWVDAE